MIEMGDPHGSRVLLFIAPMNTYSIFLALMGGALIVLWMMTFDSMVHRLHKADHKLWISLGAPRGWFWRSSNRKWFKGAVVRRRLISEIFHWNPQWIEGHEDLRRIWRRMFLLQLLLLCIPLSIGIILLFHPIVSHK